MADIWVYDVIGRGFFDDGVTGEKIRDELAQLEDGEDLDVHINSPGGDVFEGVTIKTLLDQWDGNVTVHIDGLAASAASVVAMAGREILIAEGAAIMIHEPWTVTIGDTQDHEKAVVLLDKVGGSIAEIYANRTKGDAPEMRELMRAETWLFGQEAVDAGFADKVMESKAKAWKVPELFGYKHAPKAEKTDDVDTGDPALLVPNRLSVAARQRRIDAARRGAYAKEVRKE